MRRSTGPRRRPNRAVEANRAGTVVGAGLLLAAVAAIAGCGGAAPPYPARPITIICPWAEGGGTDRVARFWAESLARELRVPVIVENKTGGAGETGHRAGAEAPPDGYTLTMITFELSTMRAMGVSELTYGDFECLLQVNADPAAIIVRKDAPWGTLRALLDAARAAPGTIKMSGTARGGAWDLARAGLLLADGQTANAVAWIPAQGAAPSLGELVQGNIDAVCCSLPEAAPAAADTRVLAVMSDERVPQFPDVPTARESGIDWTATGWRGLAAPRNMPPEIVDRLRAACGAVAASPVHQAFMEDSGFTVMVREGPEFTEFLGRQDVQWDRVIQAAGFAAKP
ncbi:MAG: tripartite tricarboxylate transporter substrate binding protein [Planctomycetes bacterium]|nr:tripartite tricarboxylate transporter substrate binding protein [Planctomycetota bacterium]